MDVSTSRRRSICMMLGTILLTLLAAGTETALADVCDSAYRVTVFRCADVPGVFPLKVTAIFSPGLSDVTTFSPGDHDVYPGRPVGAGPLTGAWVNGTWVPFGTTTYIPLIPGWCLEVRVGTDQSGCQHIHIQCLPCPPQAPLE
jgi:hypothetical protein